LDASGRAAIGHALTAESNNINAAARRLGMHRKSLQQKIKQLEEDDSTASRVSVQFVALKNRISTKPHLLCTEIFKSIII